ncbi:Protein serine/threonine phosphatase [Syntrophobacter sp. SbD1]|nr:Protein serine/threonine phosphatase [Syntrophobacter sp. SbD1]
MQIESITHPGLHRENNEDRYLVNVLDNDHVLLVIADGMGGHAAGEVAAQLAVGSFENCNPGGPDVSAQLTDRIEQAQRKIIEHSMEVPSFTGMGTTLSALFLAGRTAFWAHVGDTRIYHMHGGLLIRITDDHTIPGMFLKKGEITREQARLHPYGNVLTRCLGCENYQPDSGGFDTAEGDSVLLTTDGLHDLMPDEQIAAILLEDITLTEKLDLMVKACLKAGGKDNITAVIATI